MKKFYYPAIIAVFITGCTSASIVSNVEPNVANKADTANVSVNATNVTVNQTTVVPSNQTNPLPPPSNLNRTDMNAANSTNANQTLTDISSVSKRNAERLRSKGENGRQSDPEPIPATKATPNPAPDNSEISSTMNEKGIPIETRVFKNNAMLIKIERTFTDFDNPTTKVYLKNGKVLILRKGALAKPETATGDEILRAAGVNP